MKKSTTTIPTASGSSYIGKLCRHFRHKIDTAYTKTTGLATFPYGNCTMLATPDTLVFDISAPNTENVDQIKGVLVRHLVKFAYKEELIISWKDE